MARDASFEDRKKQRELEDQEEAELKERRKSGVPTTGGRGGTNVGRTGDAETDKLLEGFQRAEPLIEQLNNLYNQFATGVELRPPLERRKQLDQLIVTMQGLGKPTPSYQFRFQTLYASYITHRDRWDKLIKDLESGKIKRITGPKRTG